MKSPNRCRGIQPLGLYLNYIIIRRENKKRFWRECFINTKGNYIYVIGINLEFYSSDFKNNHDPLDNFTTRIFDFYYILYII